jgi:hypothetical protein
LKEAATKITTDVEVESAVREVGVEVDRDTQGVAGWAPIVDTIFRKIDSAAIFVPDLTFVGTRLDGRPTPNPNVLVECGWALKSLQYERILPIMNVRYGSPTGDAMPFNMRHLRHPVQYELDESANEQDRRTVRTQLIGDIRKALRPMLALDAIRNLLPQPPKPEPFRAVSPRQGSSRFRAVGEPIGIADGFVGGDPIHLRAGPAMWLRLMPLHQSDTTYSATELRELVRKQAPRPMDFNSYNTWGLLRADDGFGYFAIDSNDAPVQSPAMVFVFESGELWAINSRVISVMREVPYIPDEFTGQLDRLASFLRDQLGVSRPYRWIAGIEGVKERPLVAGQRVVGFPTGHCVADVITEQGIYSEGESTALSLRPFFTKILEKCGVNVAEAGRLLPSG